MNETMQSSDGLLPAEPAATPEAADSPVPDDAKNALHGTDGNEAAAPAGPDDRPGQEPGPDADLPERYELAVPQGMDLDEAMLAEFTPVARELGLGNEQAQALADAYARRMQAMAASQIEGWNRQTEELARAVLADREIGGGAEAFAEKRMVMKRALTALGDRDLARAFEEGRPIHPNSPGLLRALYRLGQASREDGFVEGGLSGGGPGGGPQAWARSLYPTLTNAKE